MWSRGAQGAYATSDSKQGYVSAPDEKSNQGGHRGQT